MTQTIGTVLAAAAKEFITVTDSPQLDADILLAHILQKPRSYLYAFPEYELTTAELKQFSQYVARHSQGEPIAYLTGHREFWSLDLMVTPDTLIPRPETELLVELLLQKLQGEKKIIADLGTGSGAIALSVAKERPDWVVHATDNSVSALQVAQKNAQQLQVKNIFFHQGSWCDALPPLLFDAIVSNPPYVAENDPHINATVSQYEPRSALFSANQGLADLEKIIKQSINYIIPGGYLLLEHGFEQAQEVQRLFADLGYHLITSYPDLAGHERITMAMRAKE